MHHRINNYLMNFPTKFRRLAECLSLQGVLNDVLDPVILPQ